MKSLLFIAGTILVIIGIQFMDFTEGSEEPAPVEYAIAIHGGAGTFSRNFPDSVKEEYLRSLKEALELGRDLLHKGESSLNVAEKVVKFLEDDPKFNAGRGSVYTKDGTHEMDASIMNGKDLSAGAVAGVTGIKNPISLARLVMEKTPHILISGSGAEQFAKEHKVKIETDEYFHNQRRFEQWQKTIKDKKGTVGCVALDKNGDLAAATSTGGMTNKMPGRIGDVPIIGAGNYANNKTCAVSGTGWGEKFIKNMVAFNISSLMIYKNLTLDEAAHEVINNQLQPDDGGIIAVDSKGNIVMKFNSEGMLRASANSNGLFEVKIWK